MRHFFSAYRNIFGTDPKTGFARRPMDNVGVQYGLGALNSGAISASQFLDLNEKIGGFDADANLVASRTSADVSAVRTAYRTGRLTHGGGGLATIPIIDYRAYTDDLRNTSGELIGDLHLRYFSFAMRERLRKANGLTDNHVMLIEDRGAMLYSLINSSLLQSALRQLDLSAREPLEGHVQRSRDREGRASQTRHPPRRVHETRHKPRFRG